MSPKPRYRPVGVAIVARMCYLPVMLSVTECLDRASEMEKRAATSPTLTLRAECLDAAIRWRDLARRALIHGNVDVTAIEPTSDEN